MSCLIGALELHGEAGMLPGALRVRDCSAVSGSSIAKVSGSRDWKCHPMGCPGDLLTADSATPRHCLPIYVPGPVWTCPKPLWRCQDSLRTSFPSILCLSPCKLVKHAVIWWLLRYLNQDKYSWGVRFFHLHLDHPLPTLLLISYFSRMLPSTCLPMLGIFLQNSSRVSISYFIF